MHRIEKIELYQMDVKVKKESTMKKGESDYERAKKTKIMEFSKASEKRLLFICRNSGHMIKSQIALTYHFKIPETGEEIKKQIHHLLIKIQREYGKIYYLWVLEFQERGAPHFHLFTSLPADNVICRVIGTAWNKIIKEDEQHLRFQTDSRSMIEWKMISGKYLSSQYVSKQKQKQVPENFKDVGRFWAASRNMKPEKETLYLSGQNNMLDKIMTDTVRIVTRRYEKELKKYKIKKKYRNQVQSYSLPSKSKQLKKILGDMICGSIPAKSVKKQ